MQKILLLDIENQPKKIRELNHLLKQYDQVILVYANDNLHIALDDLITLSHAIQEKRLLVIKMPKAGANSADFGLTFIAGRLSAQLEHGSSIDVMSNDAALSYAVDLLGQMGICSQQLKQLVEPIKALNVTATETKQVQVALPIVAQPKSDALLMKIIQFLLKNQPKKLKSLLKSIMSWGNLDSKQAEEMIEQLQKHKLLFCKSNKLEYQLKAMKKFVVQSTKAVLQQSELSFSKDDIQTKPHLMRVKQYSDYLVKIEKHRPSSLEALRNSIKAVLKFENDAQTEHMLNLLKKHKIVQIKEEKLIFLSENIQKWAEIGLVEIAA
ncbi:PIN domain-containing protein [Acinetobacter sp. MD2(2019)]|uniref:PIN domain-containing protein n=1 Tax=Acinetobacter sp. MD2(2019) TaxID=2605273 RepID=UPI002D1F3C14|nr:PIN domain-containing protein [Acinetobacter sp. MD2(2019)]MEB3753053.1 hypothetical protein [Acinetobacter sp. MD2(2019)]